jgi:putative tricarboxylic transport membrane protein
MRALNRDAIVALVLLVIGGVFFVASFEIRDPGYGQMGSHVWPQINLALLIIMTLFYLGQSLKAGRVEEADPTEVGDGFVGWLKRYKNAFYCYILFFGFLLSLPVLGMLLGGILFVFLLLNALGGWQPRTMVKHFLVAVISIGIMWSIFTFALRVILPEGMIMPGF